MGKDLEHPGLRGAAMIVVVEAVDGQPRVGVNVVVVEAAYGGGRKADHTEVQSRRTLTQGIRRVACAHLRESSFVLVRKQVDSKSHNAHHSERGCNGADRQRTHHQAIAITVKHAGANFWVLSDSRVLGGPVRA